MQMLTPASSFHKMQAARTSAQLSSPFHKNPKIYTNQLSYQFAKTQASSTGSFRSILNSSTSSPEFQGPQSDYNQ
jgi:hypothetical protein